MRFDPSLAPVYTFILVAFLFVICLFERYAAEKFWPPVYALSITIFVKKIAACPKQALIGTTIEDSAHTKYRVVGPSTTYFVNRSEIFVRSRTNPFPVHGLISVEQKFSSIHYKIQLGLIALTALIVTALFYLFWAAVPTVPVVLSLFAIGLVAWAIHSSISECSRHMIEYLCEERHA